MKGTWSSDPRDTGSLPGYSIYMRDGTLIFVGYNDIECKELGIVVHGIWRVEGNLLYVEATRSSDPAWIPIGVNTVDEIITINDKAAVLKSESGENLLRIKSIQCYYGDAI